MLVHPHCFPFDPFAPFVYRRSTCKIPQRSCPLPNLVLSGKRFAKVEPTKNNGLSVAANHWPRGDFRKSSYFSSVLRPTTYHLIIKSPSLRMVHWTGIKWPKLFDFNIEYVLRSHNFNMLIICLSPLEVT